MLVARAPENVFFFEKFYRGHDPPHPRRSLYTPPVETQAPAHPERLHITGSKADHARHGTHARTLEGWQRVRNCADLDSVQNLKKVNEKIYFFAKTP